MPNTGPNCDLYFALTQDAVNKLLRLVRRQRPSLLNYATPDVVRSPSAYGFQPVTAGDVVQPVIDRRNPLYTIRDPITLKSASGQATFEYFAQLRDVALDFAPSDIAPLPAPPPLADGSFAFVATVAAGFGLQRATSAPPFNTFRLQLFVTGTLAFSGQLLVPVLKKIQIEHIEPPGLDDALIAYLDAFVTLVAFPMASLPLSLLTLGFGGLGSVSFAPSPVAPPAIPANPQISGNTAIVRLVATVTAQERVVMPRPISLESAGRQPRTTVNRKRLSGVSS
jgi:hypothetical protein